MASPRRAGILQQSYAEVPIDAIQPHPRNPRLGDVNAVAESIAENDFYGACLVQKSTSFILVGNHRWRAAKAEGLATLPVIYADLSDAQALKILLADNRTSDLGSYAPQLLAEILTEVQHTNVSGLHGTGYTDADRDELLSGLTEGILREVRAPGQRSLTDMLLGGAGSAERASADRHRRDEAEDADAFDDEGEADDDEASEGEAGITKGDDPGIAYQNRYAVAVLCRDEAHQQAVFEQLAQMGFECKVLVV